MECIRVKPFEIPRHLLEQKKLWNLEVFYALAYKNPDAWMSFMLEESGVPVGCFILYDDPLYDSIATQTLIVDKQWRMEAVVSEASRLVYDAMKAIAIEFGRKRIMAQVRNPQKFIERLGNPEGVKIGESVLMEEVL